MPSGRMMGIGVMLAFETVPSPTTNIARVLKLEDDWKQSPLYLALKDPSTKETATVMNDEADTLSRIWCVF